MKTIKILTCVALAGVFLAGPLTAKAGDPAPAGKVKPYPLSTCIVSGEKLGDMGEAYVFTYEGQEIKLCCKSCKKDFDKDPKKYLKKLSSPKTKDK